MPENYDETYENHDLNGDLALRQELLEEANQLAQSEDSQALYKVRDLQRKWKKIPSWESAYENELQEQFDGYIDTIYAKKGEIQKAAAQRKAELIKEANALLEAENMNQAVSKMDTLMDEWKAAGSASKEEDDALWEQFSAARKAFFEKKKQKRQEQLEQFEAVNEKKKALIEKAREITANPSNWNAATAALNGVMDEWKAAGSAGQKYEPALWEEFSSIRSAFFSARSDFYKEVRREQARKYDAKKELVATAQQILDSHDFSRDAMEKMKSLSKEWKEIGYCGKDKDDAIWAEFRKVMDAYFDELGENRQKKHQDWVYHMEDIKDRKLDLIANQEKQVRRLENELNGLISQGRAEEIEDIIAEKESFIEKLREEINDIDRRIEN